MSAATAVRRFAKAPIDLYGRPEFTATMITAISYIAHLCWLDKALETEITDEELGHALCIKPRQVLNVLTALRSRGVLEFDPLRLGARRIRLIDWETPLPASAGAPEETADPQSITDRRAIHYRSARNRLPNSGTTPLRADSDETKSEQTAGSTPTESMPESGRKGGEAASACSSKEEERSCPDKGTPRRATGVYERLQQLAVNKTQAWAMADKRDLGWVERQVHEFAARKANGFRKGLPAFLWLRHLWDEDSEGAAPRIPRVRAPEPILARPGPSADPEDPPPPETPQEAARRAAEQALIAETLSKIASWKSEAQAGGSRGPGRASPEYREKMQQVRSELRRVTP